MDITYFLQENTKSSKVSKIQQDKHKNDQNIGHFVTYLNQFFKGYKNDKNDNNEIKTINSLEYTFLVQFARLSGSIINTSWFIEIVNRLDEKEFTSVCKEAFNIFNINNESNGSNKLSFNIEKIFNELIDSKKNIIDFTNDQKKAIYEVITYLSDHKRNTYAIFGFPGSGKSTIIVEIFDYLISSRLIHTVAFTAPTNKAVNIMKSKMRSNIKNLVELVTNKKYDKNNFDIEDAIDILHNNNIKIDFITIHRLLNYKNDFDNEGDRIFIRNGISSINNYEVIIIDECSMIPIQIVTHLFEDIRKCHADSGDHRDKLSPKIIFLGDRSQLNPISEDISSIFINKKEQLSYDNFSKTMLKVEKCIKFKHIMKTQAIGSVQRYNNLTNDIITMKHITLKEVVRNKIGNVINLCNNIREWVEGTIKAPTLNKFVGEGVYIYKHDNKLKKTETEWFKKFITLQKNNENLNISNIILTWTNKQTDDYNMTIRNIMFKDKKNIEKFEMGDILMLNDFYNFDETQVKGKDTKNRFYTSEQIKVMDKDIFIKDCNEFVEQISKIMIKMKNSDVILNKYKNLIKILNTKTTRKYTTWKLAVQRMSESLIKDTIPELYTIYVIHDQSNYVLELDKETSLNLIKKFRMTMIEQFKEHENKIDKEFVRGLWKQWNKIFVDPFAKVNYGNSHSVHKSQGSTFYNVFVDSDDILNNNNIDEAKRCIYTALTRASNEIHLLV